MMLDLNDIRLRQLKAKIREEDKQKMKSVAQQRAKAKCVHFEIQDLQKDANQIIIRVAETYECLRDYKDTIYRNLARPALFWPDGSSLGFGFGSHISGSAQRFYDRFKYWGFRDLTGMWKIRSAKNYGEGE
jgi:hypothetical protein